MIPPLLAQTGSEAAASIINQSLQIQSGIQESWSDIWLSVTDPESPGSIWFTTVEGAQILAMFVLIYLLIQFGNEFSKTRYLGKVIETFIWPVVVIVLLGGNGQLLSQLVLTLRGVFDYILAFTQRIQIAGIEIGVAARQLQLNGLGATRIRQLYNECEGLSGEELARCFESKADEAQAIVDALGTVDAEVDTSPLQAFLDVVLNFTVVGTIQDATNPDYASGGFAALVQDRLFPLIQTILFALQWAFVNAVEAAIVLTAVLAPLALVLSLLPASGKAIVTWGTAFISLYGVKFGYVLIVGLLSSVLVNTDGNAAELASEYGFLIFVSVFSPVIATSLASWGGISLFQTISRRAASVASAVSRGASTVLTGGFLK
jgi:hypothetical protein